MITILSSGIAGCGEKVYFKKFVEYCKKKGKKVKLISVTEKVLEIASKTHPEIDRYNLLNFPRTARDAWYQIAFKSILEELRKGYINLVNIHVTYWWKEGPDEVVKAYLLNEFFKKLDPLFFIQIVDTAERIKERVDKVVEHIGRALSLEDIYRWQDMESFTVEIFASTNKKQLYLIPQAESGDVLYRLTFSKDPKVYISFPMSHLRKTEKTKLENFIKRLNQLAIVFNPEKIEEFPGYPGRLKRIASDATVKKDFRLIAQSDFVIAYFPKLVHSAGVISEMNFASSIGKKVFLIWPFKKYSPFISQPTQRMFNSPEECLHEIGLMKGRDM
jgi:adenylate kinase